MAEAVSVSQKVLDGDARRPTDSANDLIVNQPDGAFAESAGRLSTIVQESVDCVAWLKTLPDTCNREGRVPPADFWNARFKLPIDIR